MADMEVKPVDLEEDEEKEEDEEPSWSSDSEVGDTLDWLDSKDDDQAELMEWEGRLNVGMSNSVTTAIQESVLDIAIGKTKTTEKADCATVDQAIDPRTRMVSSKMLNRGVFHDINGCISTGKEANVYHATRSIGQELAIKKCDLVAYSEVVPVFENWSYYLVFNTVVVKCRLKAAGIHCPTPILLRLHVLVMEFVGKVGWAAPRLKDAALSLDRFCEGYVEVCPYSLSHSSGILGCVKVEPDFYEMIIAMRALYQKCKLVHGDLSEYNILYFEGHLYIIDVSQSIDLDHPHALNFLREDCLHVSDHQEIFIVIASNLFYVQQKFLARGDISVEDEIADCLCAATGSIDRFKHGNASFMCTQLGFDLILEAGVCTSLHVWSLIPKTLEHVKNAGEDVQWITNGQDTGDMYYQTITGLKHALSIA
ncbi:serine/threonine-protein kinase rio1-like [Juglans microcarpa x Juglans regia]|uniref:serine/threonine-protein kinase rio1-like n=1 Tax=Juglans microcarpa x Juglans regia TaxID=2249226 RepID=UPI001B7D9853|nr:serine/threonine-protein kinase rio1-like [Juglans microcarpa x Juglans regia]